MDYIEIIEAVLLIAFAIASVTPTEKDDKVVGRIRNIFDKLRGR